MEAPKDLDAEAKKCWNRYIDLITPNAVNLDVLKMACSEWSYYWQCVRTIQKLTDSAVNTERGSIKSHPACAERDKGLTRYLKCLKQLGLNVEPEDGDELGEFFS